MKFYIQMGHGMESICKDLSLLWKGATVILSPANIVEDKLQYFSQTLQKLNGQLLFDPQIYTPRKRHKNLQQYSYWPQTDITDIEYGEYDEILKSLYKINEQIQSEAFILPSHIIGRIDKRWNDFQRKISNQAKKTVKEKRLIHTIALKSEVLSDEDQVEEIIQYSSQWDVDGVYIVCEHPEHFYFVDKPLWVANLLSLVAGIKRQRKSVIVGYTSHQMLCLALAKCDAIAAGNHLNVRWFQPEHFETIVDADKHKRQSKWYYCPQAFSEYKLNFLDTAKEAKILSSMAPPPIMANEYSNILFNGAKPTSTGYNYGKSHRHYLHCLKVQCEIATKSTYEETLEAYLTSLKTASLLISGLQNKGIKGQNRDFSEIIDVIQAAISVFDKEFSFILSKEWNLL
jgi:uncharacterized membrane protein